MKADDLEKMSGDALQTFLLAHYSTTRLSSEACFRAILYRIVAVRKEWILEKFSSDAWLAVAWEIKK